MVPLHSYLTLLFILAIFPGRNGSQVAPVVSAFTASPPVPLLGLGAVLFRPRNVKIIKSNGDEDRLVEAGKFFVEAFWYVAISYALMFVSIHSRQSQSLRPLLLP